MEGSEKSYNGINLRGRSPVQWARINLPHTCPAIPKDRKNKQKKKLLSQKLLTGLLTI